MQDANIEALVQFQFDSVGNRVTTRDAQASWQMMTCLMNSCSTECLNKVRNSSDDHVVTSTSGEVSEDGPLFLPILISRVVVDNGSTISYYSHQLTYLDQLVIKLNYNITVFNDEVQNLIYQLQSRGKSIQHLKVNILKDMKQLWTRSSCPTSDWRSMNITQRGSVDADKLMSNAKNQ